MKNEKIYNKLVRDRIIEIIESQNNTAIYQVLEDVDYYQALLMKDEEELLEVKNAENKEEVKKELADKLEIIIAIAKIYHYSLEDIIEEANVKRNTNGGFNKKIFLEKVISNK